MNIHTATSIFIKISHKHNPSFIDIHFRKIYHIEETEIPDENKEESAPCHHRNPL